MMNGRAVAVLPSVPTTLDRRHHTLRSHGAHHRTDRSAITCDDREDDTHRVVIRTPDVSAAGEITFGEDRVRLAHTTGLGIEQHSVGGTTESHDSAYLNVGDILGECRPPNPSPQLTVWTLDADVVHLNLSNIVITRTELHRVVAGRRRFLHPNLCPTPLQFVHVLEIG
jgi:hypothetical protein